MKKLLTTIVIALCAINLFAQEDSATYKREGNNFTKIQQVQSSQDTQTIYTYTVKNTPYPIWITRNGRCYVIRISKNGKEYKQYLEESISRQICKELGVEYKVLAQK